jgi:hypothetical protein
LSASIICRNCGTLGSSYTQVPGSCLIELVLWCAMILPGLIYSLWRHGSQRKACAKCGSAELVPISTPVGRDLVARFHPPTEALRQEVAPPPPAVAESQPVYPAYTGTRKRTLLVVAGMFVGTAVLIGLLIWFAHSMQAP